MQREHFERVIDRVGADAVVRALRPYLTPARMARIERVLEGRVDGVHVAMESPSDPHNAAAVVRTAEAMGVLGVHVIAAEGDALHKKATTQGAYHWVETRHHLDLDDFLSQMKGRVVLAGAWMGAALRVEELPLDRPLCLLLGNEQRGLSAAAREACDLGFHIPMVGMSESLNLSVSAAIGLYTTLTRKRAEGRSGDLSPGASARLRAKYYLRSVDPRLVSGLFDSS